MITLRPTQMLAQRISAIVPAAPVPVELPYTDWCAHTFTAQRYRYVILTNTFSLLSVVAPGTGLTTEDAFVRHAISAIREYLRASQRTSALERLVGPAGDEVRLARLSDRAVMGSMNELIYLAKLDLIEGGLSPAETSERLNEVPLSMLWKRGGAPHPGPVFDSMPADLRSRAPR